MLGSGEAAHDLVSAGIDDGGGAVEPDLYFLRVEQLSGLIQDRRTFWLAAWDEGKGAYPQVHVVSEAPVQVFGDFAAHGASRIVNGG